jgi:hypothetical protein
MPAAFLFSIVGPISLLQLQSLFIYSSYGEVPLPHSLADRATWGRAPPPVQRAMLIFPSGGCRDTMCHLFAGLKQIRSWCPVACEPPWFLCIPCMGKLCAGWECGGVRVLPLHSGFSCLVFLQCLRKIFTLRNTCYLLPPSNRHVGKSPEVEFLK